MTDPRQSPHHVEAAAPDAAPGADRPARPRRHGGCGRAHLLYPLRGYRLSIPSSPASNICRSSSSTPPAFISSSACIATSGASRRCPTSTSSCAPRRCSRSRCSRSITCCSRRTSTAPSSSARSPFCSTGSCRCSFSPARASPTAISATRARCNGSRSPTRRRRWCSAAPPTPKCCCAASKAAR